MIRHLARLPIFLLVFLAQGGPSERHAIVLDPEHSHAAGIFSRQFPKLSPEIHLYAPPGPDADAFVNRIESFNHRAKNPTHWTVKSYLGPDFLERVRLEPPGNMVVLSGRNDIKMDRILSSLRAGQNVLADKPWIIDSKQFPSLETALNYADQHHLIAYDSMTQRYDVTYQIQRELMRDPAVFGTPVAGTASDPAVTLENVHSLIKGKSQRPPWYFDVHQQGEAIADVGTHLIDLEFWTLFPDQGIDYRRDVKVLKATRAPLFISRAQFQRATGSATWPRYLQNVVKNDTLEYDCNNTAVYTVRGIYAHISDRWEYESVGALSDSYLASYRGSRATVRVRQSKVENYIPEIDIIPASGQDVSSLKTALQARLTQISGRFPNLGMQDNRHGGIRVVIPHEDRGTGGDLVLQFLKYLSDPQRLPVWEKPNMLAKYDITTTAVDMANRSH
jgi:hypothetical protein